MCDMTNCYEDAVSYVVVKPASKDFPADIRKRVEVCGPHLDMAHQLASSDLTKIVEEGPL